jgi:hypothetical protein
LKYPRETLFRNENQKKKGKKRRVKRERKKRTIEKCKTI